MDGEKDRLRFSIGRFDHYYDSVNNKCNVFLALSIFIFGALAGFYPALVKIVECGPCIHTLMIALLLMSLGNMIIVLTASAPYLTSETDSLLYFSSIANMGKPEFSQASSIESEDDELKDLRQQTFELASGLRRKFEKLRLASFLFGIQFVVFIPWILLIITNLKNNTL